MKNTDQCCVGRKKIYPPRKAADTFLERFRKELEALVPGDPMDPNTTLGSLRIKGALEFVEKHIQNGSRW